MNTTLTICDFLAQSGAQVTFFDMGRRVVEITQETMHRFEHAEIPYPLPFLRQAWLGLLIRYPENENQAGDKNTESSSHSIWFIKFPVDEQGLLIQAARDDFLRRLLENMAASHAGDSQPHDIDDNPHGFTPREDKMAVFHARIARLLDMPPSQFYSHARDYFSGKTGYDQWNFVGLQGIADIAVRLDEDNNESILTSAIAHVPGIPFAALCSCLENVTVNEGLSREIINRINKDLEESATAKVAADIAAGLRGLSGNSNNETLQPVLKAILGHPVGHDVEVLAAIAGRCWDSLENEELRKRFLEAAAACEAGQQAFDSLLADLLFMPGLRQSLKEELHNSGHSQHLTKTIDVFLASIHSPIHSA